MSTLPQDIVNRGLDAIGSRTTMGAFTDGTTVSEAARRIYTTTLEQLLRAAHWAFARKRGKLELLGDASGETTPFPGNLPISTQVEPPWRFAYAWPIDGLQARWLPASWEGSANTTGTVGIPPGNVGVAVPGFEENAAWAAPQAPARFLVSSSDQYPVVLGQTGWDNMPDFALTQGVGPISRRIILTNQCHAHLVYTKMVQVPDEWDPLFSQAMVAVLGSMLAMVPDVLEDRKFALTMRAQQISIAKDAIAQARVANGNDSGMPQTVNHIPDWIRARQWGSYNRGVGIGANGMLYGEEGPGVWGYGWGSMAFADGGVF
jgi:hypothetical protein